MHKQSANKWKLLIFNYSSLKNSLLLINLLKLKCINMMDKFGVFHSDFPDVELPNQNTWQFLYPELKKWRTLTAFVDSKANQEVTYDELISMSFCWAKELKKFFLSSTPPKVLLMLPNRLECLPVIVGCLAVGVTVCPMPHDAVEEIVQIIIAQLKPEVLVIESSTYEVIQHAIKRTGAQPHVYGRGQTSVCGVDNLNNILSSGDCLNENEMGQYDADNIAIIAYSSGTTGNPKGIMLRHLSIVNAICTYDHGVLNHLKPADECEQEAIITNLPFSHVFGVQWYVLIALRFGHKVVCIDLKKIKDAASYIREYQPKLLVSSANKVDLLNEVENVDDLKSLRTILTTGSPANVDGFRETNRKLGNKIFLQDCYGATECNVIAMTPLNDKRPEMSGKLVSNCKAKVIDFNTGECVKKPYQQGELLFKGPGIMIGYLNNPEATKKAIDSDGWYHTGDICYFDENNFFKILDRHSDLITVCVEKENIKVAPSKIETVIKQHPCVLDVGVVGIPYLPSGEEIPKAFVIRKGPIAEEELIKYVEDEAPLEMRLLGGVSFVQKLPRNHLGKLVRKHLRDMAWFN